FVQPFSIYFFFLYLCCGLSDVLDGYLARKLHAASKFGQVFDSVSDFVFIGVVLLILLPIVDFPPWILGWIAVVVAIRFVSLIYGFAKYRGFASLHTYANKATGVALFFYPFLFSAFGKEAPAIAICALASISASEELLILLTSKTLNRDRASIFSKGL
ncbi:MAG TPA: CDP-alcohol phosphatidyltransferase family protein, partial [Candidatus Acidoferrum sp.]|nr:CDP-alcohol phosphatidyltransferase family protein [Candidatus Acidoferrum sp.]